jgi:hypothetical protein
MSNFEFVSLGRSVSVQFGATTSEAATSGGVAASSTFADVSRHQRTTRRLAGASSSVNMLWCATPMPPLLHNAQHTKERKKNSVTKQKKKKQKKQKKQKKNSKNNFYFFPFSGALMVTRLS